VATATFVVADADAALMIESIRDSEDEECGSKNVVSQMLVTVSSFRQWLQPAGDLTHNLHLPQGGCKANKQCSRSTSMLHGGTGIFLTKSLFVFLLGVTGVSQSNLAVQFGRFLPRLCLVAKRMRKVFAKSTVALFVCMW